LVVLTLGVRARAGRDRRRRRGRDVDTGGDLWTWRRDALHRTRLTALVRSTVDQITGILAWLGRVDPQARVEGWRVIASREIVRIATPVVIGVARTEEQTEHHHRAVLPSLVEHDSHSIRSVAARKSNHG
jgi:hypothetical protein